MIYLISILLAELSGYIGSLFTAPQIATWYQALDKPIWNPPNWLFAPVWLTLYLLMGWAAAIVYKTKDLQRTWALIIYGLQLLVNIGWSLVFFGYESILGGLIAIGVLAFLIAVNLFLFWRIDQRAGWLLVPYFVWVLFAAFLNLNILLLN